MSLIDQATREVAAPEPTVAVYRRSARGLVCKVLPLTDGFAVPEGWEATPPDRNGDEPILTATSDDEPAPAPKKTRKAAE